MPSYLIDVFLFLSFSQISWDVMMETLRDGQFIWIYENILATFFEQYITLWLFRLLIINPLNVAPEYFLSLNLRAASVFKLLIHMEFKLRLLHLLQPRLFQNSESYNRTRET